MRRSLLKTGLKDVIGKEVAAVVVAESGAGSAAAGVFLYPGRHLLEFYGRDSPAVPALIRAERIERYVESGGGRIGAGRMGDAMAVRRRLGAERSPGPGSVEQLMARDLVAWRVAKEAIAKASRITP